MLLYEFHPKHHIEDSLNNFIALLNTLDIMWCIWSRAVFFCSGIFEKIMWMAKRYFKNFTNKGHKRISSHSISMIRRSILKFSKKHILERSSFNNSLRNHSNYLIQSLNGVLRYNLLLVSSLLKREDYISISFCSKYKRHHR